MGATYKATGINLKSMPMGENDRLLTILTREFGLMRAIAPGSRKHESTLRGRSGLFVVNNLLLVPGKSLDKIIQAESNASFPKLSQDLGKLTAAQYLAELCLYQALSDQPQEELFAALCEALTRLEAVEGEMAIAILVEGIVQMLYLAGVIPEVERCSVTRKPIPPGSSDSRWRVGFHPAAGGVVSLSVFNKLCARERQQPLQTMDFGAVESEFTFPARPTLVHNEERQPSNGSSNLPDDASSSGDRLSRHPVERRHSAAQSTGRYRAHRPVAGTRLTADEWSLLQQVVSRQHRAATQETDSVAPPARPDSPDVWLSLERALRYYAQYHFERAIQSAHLIDSCFASLPSTVS
ncbi:DNA repair protein RecO [Vacuolonema iberomarrocanum]|uniref:DNA repair protein RecO n=1 Tax=Vacuolonema iberomarrocanum TaxID=3454632 RepID=UPI0019EC58AE|nr:DNA repair protein RecO [filamentous cyanobacterium LEGE 07170]